MRLLLAIAAIAAPLLLAACGADEDEPEVEPASSSTSASPTGSSASAPTESSAPTPKPPDASVTAEGQTVKAGFGSFCWNDAGMGVCADSATPRCDDGYTPRVAVTAGSQVQWAFDFEPTEAPVLTVFGADGMPTPGEGPTLPTGRTTSWTVDLPNGEHPVSVFLRAAERGDVSYTACLAVTGGAAPAAADDAAACVERWNADANADVRTSVEFGLGATVEATDAGCTVSIIRLADEGGFAAWPYTEGPDGAFSAGEAAATSPPGDDLWSLDPLAGLSRPGATLEPAAPPAATFSTSAETVAVVPSAWSGAGMATEGPGGGCASEGAPIVVSARSGEPLEVGLPFEPAEPPQVLVPDAGDGPRDVVQPAPATLQWAVDLPPGRHDVTVSATTADAVAVDYTACLDVSG